ncbi:MAG: hypothetical protein ACODAQ_04760 [Phycisphaeraceae bacterium]
MSKDLTPHQQKIVKGYYEHEQTIRAEKLSDLVAEIWLCEDVAKATKLWGRAQVALMKAGCDPTQAASVVGKRDVEALAKLVQAIDAGRSGAGASTTAGEATDDAASAGRGIPSVADGRTIEQMKREKAAAAGTDSLDQDNLKRALKAFRRKLKTLRREEESQIRGRYVTRGQSSSIVAISPPSQFPPAVWQELVRLGRLKPAGQGLYQLPDQ